MSQTVPAPAAVPSQRAGWFTRMLHRSYSRGTALNFFIARRIRPAGIGVLIVIVLTAGIGFGQPKVPVYQIFSLTVGMALIAIPWAFSRRARLQAKRELPRYATVGEHVRYTIRLTNTGKKTLRRAWVAETSADPRPSAEEFAARREPDEEKRNIFDRTFA